MFREASQNYIRRTEIRAAVTPLGFLDAPHYIKLGIQTACDLIMIFQQLFWATPRRQKLSRGDLRRELEQYKESRIRESIHRLVEGEVNLGNCYNEKKLVKVIRVVVDDGCKILHSEASERNSDVGAFDEPFAELEGSEV